MDNAVIVRVLTNMIDEAKEGLSEFKDKYNGLMRVRPRMKANYEQRLADVQEAIVVRDTIEDSLKDQPIQPEAPCDTVKEGPVNCDCDCERCPEPQPEAAKVVPMAMLDEISHKVYGEAEILKCAARYGYGVRR